MTDPDFPPRGIVEAIGASTAEYTEEERRNLASFHAQRRALMADRKNYEAEGFVHHQRGIVHIPALDPAAPKGMTPASIPDRTDEIVDVIAKGDRVWALWYVTGTHDGDIYGIPATGQPIRMLELGLWRFVDGKAVEAWFWADEMALLRQIGKITEPVW
ncbi:ester cyclase [Streptomyces sp. NPDC092369]|uniref:ester cyclase n=1 Tax=Streptomyces sp. NPDC092369 TaxID=3366015 RepID=UPI00380E83B5